MGTRKTKLAVLALFCAVAIGSSTRAVAQNQDQVGEWGDILEWPLMAVHMILLKNGKVLCLYDEFDTNPNRFMVFDPADGATCSTQLITDRPIVPDSNPPESILLFCTGHNQLPDGKIVFVGGGLQYKFAHNHTVIFDPDKPLCAPWSVEDDMPDVTVPGDDPVKGKRWYPSVTKLADGTILVVGGQKEVTLPHTADIPLIFDSKKPNLQQYTELFAAEQYLPYYPFNFQLSSGEVLYAGADSEFIADHSGGESYSQVLIPTTGEAWSDVAGVSDPIMGGSAVMYGPDKIMKGGGYEVVGGGLQHWSDKIYKLDMGELNPTWEAVDFLDNPRKDFYLLALPGGKILAIGGDAEGGPGDTLIPELLEDPDDPDAVWMPMAPMTTTVDRCGVSQHECQSDADCGNCATEVCTIIADCAIGELCINGFCISPFQPDPQCTENSDCGANGICITTDHCFDIERAHHASALLLPDARVLMAGGDFYIQTHAAENNSAQIFSPPYLFASGGVPANRPDIGTVDGTASCAFASDKIISYGNDFTVTFSQVAGISEVNLIALGAASHSFDQHQRFLDLPFTAAAGVLTVTAPAAPEAAPPGYYMLFILDGNGVPSVAEIIKLDATCPTSQSESGFAVAPAPAPEDTPKNRYLSFAPNNNSDVVAFELELTDCVQFPGSVGETWWVGEPEWVAETYYLSYLSKTPVFRNWDAEGVVHIGDCRVVPVAGYDLRATPDGATFTAPLALATIPLPAGGKFWGDVVSSLINSEWGPPQGTTNIDDAVAAIQGFKEVITAPPLTWVDVEPEDPNYLVNFNDVFTIVLAFQGAQYPFGEPACCLDCRSGGRVVGNNMTFTLAPSNPFIDAGEPVDIDVFVDSIPDLGGYQLTLEVLGGTSGTLVLTDVTVDVSRADYVFFGKAGIPTADIPRRRIGNALIGAQSGVPVSGSGYLATFSYMPSESATGDFRVEVVVGHNDTSPMDSTATRLAYNGGSCTVIGVGFDCHVDADCDDGNDCTIDTCVNDACLMTDALSGTGCDDGQFCTATSECDGSGTCVGSGSPCLPRNPVCCELTDTCVAVGVPCAAPI